MYRRVLLLTGIAMMCCNLSYSEEIKISNLNVKRQSTELGGPRIVIEYDINEPGISQDFPVYVFIRYSEDSAATWKLLPRDYLRGNGHDLINKPGHKRSVWWGPCEMDPSDPNQLKFRVRGIRMVRVPGGEFMMGSLPGGGHDESGNWEISSNLLLFHMAKYETAIAMYVDYLNEVGRDGSGWNQRMSDSCRCGIIQNGSTGNYTYTAAPGREDYPVTYGSWYDAVAFLEWCGLRLPTESEWEKAFRGGIYLDGDKTKRCPNPLPERKYPWGNEEPNACGIYRCNYDGADDGFEYTAPAGSFDKFNSPYGACDMAGNVAEWTLDWYSTSYHVDLDGFRMVRGGSWMAVPFACDAITGATQLPLKESSIVGFRGVR